jgi:eukaryotic-like serine/threonine-protein kinase
MSAEGRYKAFHRIGAGGYGVVYLGAMRSASGISRRVAIKRLSSIVDADAVAVQRFTEEAQLLARLEHPNIVSIIDYHIDSSGHPSLVMEYVDGCNLAHCLAKAACPPSVAVYVAVEMLRALAYLHQMPAEAGMRGLVHRDVSPANVLLSWNGRVVLSDFGISKVMDTHGVQTGTFRGKAAYSAPEHIDNRVTDGRADLFSVGAVLWEMIAGRALFQAESQAMTFARVLRSPVPSLRDIASISPELDAVVTRLLKRKPETRYAAAEDVIRDLLTCAEWPRSGRDELTSLLAERFGRETRVIVPVDELPPKQALNVENDQETRTVEPTASGFNWDQLAALRGIGDSATDEHEFDSQPSPRLVEYRRGAKAIVRRISSAKAAAAAVVLFLLAGAYVFRGDEERTAKSASDNSIPATPISTPPVAMSPSSDRAEHPTSRDLPPSSVSLDLDPSAKSNVPKRARKEETKRNLPKNEPASAELSRYPEKMRHILGEDSESSKSENP